MHDTPPSGLTRPAVSTCLADELTRACAPKALTSLSGTPQRRHTTDRPASAHQRPQPPVQRLWRITTHPVISSWTHTVRVVWTSMARYFCAHPSTRTDGQCNLHGWDSQMIGGPPALVFRHHTRWWRRGRTPYASIVLRWPDTSMATQVCARMARASGVVGMHKCWWDPHRRFAPISRGGGVVDANRTSRLDFHGQILPWPPRYAHGCPGQAAWSECGNIESAPAVGLHVLHPGRRVVGAHRTRGLYFYGRILWADTSMATQVRARMASAGGVLGLHKCWLDHRRRCARSTSGGRVVNAHRTCGLDLYGQILLWPTTYTHGWRVQAAWLECRNIESAPAAGFHALHPGGRVVDAHRTRGLDFYSQILIWPPKYAHERPVDAALLGCRNVGGTPAVGLHPHHSVVASWTHTSRVVWTSTARYFHGNPGTRTDVQCKRRGWNAEILEAPPPSVCTHHTRRSRRGRTPYAYFGLVRPDTSMATQVHARMASASGVVEMQKN